MKWNGAFQIILTIYFMFVLDNDTAAAEMQMKNHKNFWKNKWSIWKNQFKLCEACQSNPFDWSAC